MGMGNGNGAWWWLAVLGKGGGFCGTLPTSLLPFPAADAGRNSTLSSPTGTAGMGEVGVCAVPGRHKMSHPRCQDPRGDSGRDSWSQHGVSAAQVVVLDGFGTLSASPQSQGWSRGSNPSSGRQQEEVLSGIVTVWCCPSVP